MSQQYHFQGKSVVGLAVTVPGVQLVTEWVGDLPVTGSVLANPEDAQPVYGNDSDRVVVLEDGARVRLSQCSLVNKDPSVTSTVQQVETLRNKLFDEAPNQALAEILWDWCCGSPSEPMREAVRAGKEWKWDDSGRALAKVYRTARVTNPFGDDYGAAGQAWHVGEHPFQVLTRDARAFFQGDD
jgi:hypothetical protein